MAITGEALAQSRAVSGGWDEGRRCDTGQKRAEVKAAFEKVVFSVEGKRECQKKKVALV